MKKKWLSAVLAMVMVFSITACGSSGTPAAEQGAAETTAADAKTEAAAEQGTAETTADTKQKAAEETADSEAYKVAFCTMTTEGDYWGTMFDILKEQFAAEGAAMDVIDADGDVTRQIEQIENCVTQNYNLIVLLAVDPEAVADASKRAVDAGVPVFQFIKDSGEEYRTSFRGTDETVVGTMLVECAMDWVNKTFPDAEDGSVNTILVGGNSAGSETERYEAMVAAAATHPQLNVVDAVRWETSQSYSQEATDNEITKFSGDVQLIIAASGEMALGIRSSIMAEGSMIKDYSQFGIVTCDISAETAASIAASANDEDVIRAACVNGGDTVKNMQGLVDGCMSILRGEEYQKSYVVDVAVATPDNLADFGY